MSAKKTRLAAAFCLSALINLGATPAARADIIGGWNAAAEAIAIEKRMLPPPNSRAMTIMHVAMFEAVNAIARRYSSYRLNLTAEPGLSKDAAAAAAAHAVLVALHPDQEKSLDARLRDALQTIPESEAKAGGVVLGKAAASAILQWRSTDGANAPESYRPLTIAGAYVPTAIPVSSTYGRVTPWAMTSGAQFRPASPPALMSATWAQDLNEVREFGGRAGSKRSAEQTDTARFWFVTGPQAWNPIVRQLAVSNKLDITDSARLFALVAMASDDAFIAVFDAKYHYNFWRPITAIRNADLNENTLTSRDTAWLPLGDTPMHPEYPCAHCITSMAAAAVLQAVFGNDIPEVSMTSPTALGVTRRWTRLQDYADEVAMARIYAGFHYRFSNAVAQNMGRRISELVVRTQLRPLSAAATPSR